MQNARMHCYRFGSICLFSSGLLAWLAYSVTHQLGISTLNLPIYEFFVNLHTPWLQQFAQAVTQLGNKQIIFPLLLLFTGYFAWQKNGALAMTTASLAVSSMLAVWVLKHGLAIPRPEALFIVKTTYSFPSGHTTLSVVFFGYLASFIRYSSNTWRNIALIASVLLPSLVLLTRLVLAVHWFTDVLGGVLLGIALLSLHQLLWRLLQRRC
jgi:membrane-associated phospholipid phosphatase